jgi:hypothetical protein
MNRRNFFKRLAIGAAAVVVAPKIIAEVTKPKSVWDPELEKRMYSQIIMLKNRRCGITYMYEKHPEYSKMPMSQKDFNDMVESLRPYYEKVMIWPEKK